MNRNEEVFNTNADTLTKVDLSTLQQELNYYFNYFYYLAKNITYII